MSLLKLILPTTVCPVSTVTNQQSYYFQPHVTFLSFTEVTENYL